MDPISAKELKEILEKHRLWLETRNSEDIKGERADLRNANLYKANLRGANLEAADLQGADLRDASLRGANLFDANLFGAKLMCAYLRNANLECTDLRYANLEGADLRGADLFEAYLENAKLQNANLYGANLQGVDLRGANLFGAGLDTKEQIRKGILLQKDLIGYKKCKNDLIVELIIPKGSIVFSINNFKCRTNRAKVVSITNIDGKTNYKIAASNHGGLVYTVGDDILIDDFNLMYNVECAEGIHFFRTREEAVNY